jgi:NAD(P)-dependent dehydrogenase (short-subunit alcohol dehydrogenase family)
MPLIRTGVHANAGIIDKPKFISEISFSEWNKISNINLTSMFLRQPLLERLLSEAPNTEAALQAIGQISSPKEVATLAAFLASDEASAMKGSAVIYRSGRNVRLWQRVKGDLIRSKLP